MNFDLDLEDDVGMRLSRLAEQTGKSRNTLIQEAIADWLERAERKAWPEEVEHFQGIADAPVFEEYREHLAQTLDDPLV